MKNNTIESRSNTFPVLSEKFVNDHPIVATVLYLSPIIIPAAKQVIPVVCKGVKYIVDTAADCYRFKIMAENKMVNANPVDNTKVNYDDAPLDL